MLKVRIIPLIQLNGSSVVKTINFKNFRTVGDAISTVKIFSKRMADEMVIVDINASKTKKINFKFLKSITKECFMPLTLGGGVKNETDVEKLFEVGADKIILNSMYYDDKNLLKKIISKYGNQSIVFSLDVYTLNGKNKIFSNSKRGVTKPLNIEKTLDDLYKIGVGEILFNSVDHDGIMKGYNYKLIKKISNLTNVPLIAAGGCGHAKDCLDAIKSGANAVAAGSIFYWIGESVTSIKNFLNKSNINVRML